MPSFIEESSYDSSKYSGRSFSVMDPTADSIFTADLDDVTTMSKILHELHYNNDKYEEHSVLVITREGIRLITAGERTFQVSAYFAASTFQRFKLDGDNYRQVNFRFMLKDFIESLNLLRDDPLVEGEKITLDDGQANESKASLYIQYRKKGAPLKLRLENKSNYVINCDIKAFQLPIDSMFCPLAFLDGEDYAVILLDSKKLYDYVSGMDFLASDTVQLIMGRGDIPLRLSTKSTTLGEAELTITSNETDIIKREIIVSDNCLFSFSYKTKFFKPAIEALKNSSITQMKCGSSGLLCIEHFPPMTNQSVRDGPFMRPDNNYPQISSSYPTDYNQPQNKKSSVEYFILSEARPIDACPD